MKTYTVVAIYNHLGGTSFFTSLVKTDSAKLAKDVVEGKSNNRHTYTVVGVFPGEQHELLCTYEECEQYNGDCII